MVLMKTPFAPAALVCLLLCIWPTNAVSQPYTFTTIAGTPGVGGSADGTNAAAKFNFPVGIALDGHGGVYVCDQLNNTVRQLTVDGTNWVVRTVAGSAGVRGWADGTNGDAQLDRPTGIAVDSFGDVFVSDKYNNTIRKLTPEGTNWVVTTVAGTPGIYGSRDDTNNAASFWGPAGLTINKSNHIFVADSSNHIIRRVVPEGTNWIVATVAGTALNFGSEDGVNSVASFNYPWALTADPSGVLFVADYGNQLVRRIEPINGDWVTTTVGGVLDVRGTNDGPGLQATFYDLNGIGSGTASNVFVADYGNHTVRWLTQNGSDFYVSTIGGMPKVSGTNDGVGGEALFNHPKDVCVDSTGALFICDAKNNTIRLGAPAPRLEIVASGFQVVLSWPFWANRYVLESANDLGPAVKWSAVRDGVMLLGNRFLWTNTPAGSTYFRLRQL